MVWKYDFEILSIGWFRDFAMVQMQINKFRIKINYKPRNEFHLDLTVNRLERRLVFAKRWVTIHDESDGRRPDSVRLNFIRSSYLHKSRGGGRKSVKIAEIRCERPKGGRSPPFATGNSAQIPVSPVHCFAANSSNVGVVNRKGANALWP